MNISSKISSMTVIGLGLILAIVSGTEAADIDITTPEGAVAALRKVQCSTVDEKPVVFWWHGFALSRRMGEPDKRLFNVEGMNVRQCVSLTGEGGQGTGYRLVSREILMYTDLKTGEPLESWDNPWTGATVKVLHVENDPVNQRPIFPYTKDGKPAMSWRGSEKEGRWWMTSTIPLFYHNELGGDYQKQVGPAYHATEMFNFLGDIDSLVDGERDSADVQVGWVRMSDWLPWMEMQGREGVIYMHTAGLKITGIEALGPNIRKYIDDKAPQYLTPPPGDDTRPNETSWTYFKKTIEGERLPRGGAN